MNIIPAPVEYKPEKGSFTITEETRILIAARSEKLRFAGELLAETIRSLGGPEVKTAPYDEKEKAVNAILLTIAKKGKEESGSPEGYTIKVAPHGVVITGNTESGTLYGVQSLLQMLGDKGAFLPCAVVRDHPAFAWRGMHLDVSRHFFPKEFVKRYIDLIAMYKMNIFHWHLTDDNGWRIEIKKYPKLMEISAWRVDREHLPWGERPPQQPGERATYGGYYTQDEIREIVRYAELRNVTVIPEIEMPAHSVEVLAAYPQFSCTGGPFTVPPGSYWPNIDILCAGNDSVFTFLEDVLTEVIDLFPSSYIHIGGDEADKSRWKVCPKCQQRMKENGLKDEKELQSYFIKRMEKFIVSKGKKMIGWDEILEGGLAPEATVMSWRGIEGGIAAARQGHDAIMTPTSHCYFDYYQANPKFEPKAIGGFTTLKKVYSYHPVPEELTAEEAKHILGAQGNVWTEFIPTPSHAEYMALPRMIALAEVVWTPKSLRDWDDFRRRLEVRFKTLDRMGINYSKGSFKADIRTGYDAKTGKVMVTLSSEQPGVPIRYSTDGKDPDKGSSLYTGPFAVDGNCILKAALFVNDTMKEEPSEIQLIFHKAIGKPVTYLSKYSYRYPAAGDGALTDGIRGSTNHRDGYWQGFLGKDAEVIIDLGKEEPIKNVSVTYLRNQRSWIFLPDFTEFSLSSDGKKYHSINEQLNKFKQKDEEVAILPLSQIFPSTPARFIKIKVKNPGVCPSWHEGAGESCWIFLDEILVY